MLTAVAGFTAVGGFLVDWNRTHLFNPDWPPHAKFHDAQSILLGSFVGASGLYFLWKNDAKTSRLERCSRLSFGQLRRGVSPFREQVGWRRRSLFLRLQA